MKKGFIIPLIVIAIFAGAGYYLFQHFARTPNEETQQAAKSIKPYPKSISWQIKDSKNICFLATDECSQPTILAFQTQDPWSNIYHYYRENMLKNGWQTNSEIIVSVPPNILFTTNSCRAYLEESPGFSENYRKKAIPTYKFTVACYQQI